MNHTDRNWYRPGVFTVHTGRETCSGRDRMRLRMHQQRLDVDPGWLANAQEQAMILSLAVSLLAVSWLGICAFFDTRTRQVFNRLTLPAIPLALLAAGLTRENRGESYKSLCFTWSS